MSSHSSIFLEDRIHDYWELSSTIRGRNNSKITVGQAIYETNVIKDSAGHHRHLFGILKLLTFSLIDGLPKTDTPQFNNIRQLKICPNVPELRKPILLLGQESSNKSK